MQFHHHGYVSVDPRVPPAAGVGLDRPEELPDEVDVLIVGSGPAGMIAAAQQARDLDRDGVLVVVRPDHHVSHVLPLDAHDQLAEFFHGVITARHPAETR